GFGRQLRSVFDDVTGITGALALDTQDFDEIAYVGGVHVADAAVELGYRPLQNFAGVHARRRTGLSADLAIDPVAGYPVRRHAEHRALESDPLGRSRSERDGNESLAVRGDLITHVDVFEVVNRQLLDGAIFCDHDGEAKLARLRDDRSRRSGG